MNTTAVHQAYNDVVATHYDLDPQGVIGRALDLGIGQMKAEGLLTDRDLHVLDIGMGTGLFLEKLQQASEGRIIPFGIDLAESMLEVARRRLPDLDAVAGDASKLDAYFKDREFDCVCTHFVTGFVSMRTLAPQIAGKLLPGGCWSLVGGTKAAYPALQAKGDSRFLRWYTGAGSRRMDDTVLNPADAGEVAEVMEANGFEVLRSETFRPTLNFENFDGFMEFAYHGGWLTPLIESMGLHRAGAAKRWLLNRLAFPIQDSHDIVAVLGRKR
ncbi:class I SAM-dependent methyltransferase [Paludisphaera rhizosphaerae]|uniref:class I SAM-dependent methyltransferase n=1 Tax=Paludisphaera rhizosphaerae TaxID=2711216 RepID=UPI0013ED4016|nr:class I SAM-dependent methyltransferase [Paludisphaera rhizosphaerae]